MKKIKRSIAITCMFMVISVGTANALIPAVLLFGLPEAAVWASAIFHASVGAAVYYFSHNGNNKTVNSTNVESPGHVEWVELTGDPEQPTKVMTAPINVKAPTGTVKQISKDNPTEYPSLSSATTVIGSYPDPSYSMSTGSYYKIGTSNYQVVSTWQSNPNAYCSNTSTYPLPYSDDGTRLTIPEFAGQCGTNPTRYYTTIKQFTYTLTGIPPDSHDASDSEFADMLNSNPEVYSGDIDKLIKNNPNICSFGDENGNPVASQIPSNALTQAQINSARALAAAADALAAALAAAQQAEAAAAANPGDASLANQAAALRAAYEALRAQQARNDQQDSEDDEPITSGNVPSPYGDGTTSDFGQRFSQFTDDMKGSSLFGTPAQLVGNIPSGGSSVFNVSFGRFGSTTFDLASFGQSFVLIRFLFLFSCTVVCVRIMTLKGGSG